MLAANLLNNQHNKKSLVKRSFDTVSAWSCLKIINANELKLSKTSRETVAPMHRTQSLTSIIEYSGDPKKPIKCNEQHSLLLLIPDLSTMQALQI